MSETIVKILVAELTLVRLTCTGCGLTVEMPVSQLYRQHQECQLCKRSFGDAAITEAFNRLRESLAELQAAADKVKVEFVIPAPQD